MGLVTWGINGIVYLMWNDNGDALYPGRYQLITVSSRKWYGVSNQRWLDSLYNCLFLLTSNYISKPHINVFVTDPPVPPPPPPPKANYAKICHHVGRTKLITIPHFLWIRTRRWIAVNPTYRNLHSNGYANFIWKFLLKFQCNCMVILCWICVSVLINYVFFD